MKSPVFMPGNWLTFFCNQTTHLKRILKSLWAHNKIVNSIFYIHTSKENVYINYTSENVKYYVMFWLLERALNLNNGCLYAVIVVGRWVSWLSGIRRSYKKNSWSAIEQSYIKLFLTEMVFNVIIRHYL